MLEDETIHVHLDWTHYPHDPSNTPSALTFTSTSVRRARVALGAARARCSTRAVARRARGRVR